MTQLKQAADILSCPICGSFNVHTAEECSYLINAKHIPNKKVHSKAFLSLPDELKIEALSNGDHQVRTKQFIHKGTLFGPLEAVKSLTLNPSVRFPLKIFPNDQEEFFEYYLDTTNEQDCTWMIFVEPAEVYEEQNIMCYEDQHNIYYVTVKDVNENECLKVWYAPHYAEKMGKQPLPKGEVEATDDSIKDINKLVKNQQKILQKNSWICKFCGNIVADVTEFAQHIIQHYKAQLRKTCEVCKSSFISRKSLHKHMCVVHDPEIKKKIVFLNPPEPNFTHNTSKELSIGGPLLYHMDNLDNSNQLLPNAENLNEDLQNMGTENLNVDNLLTENVKAFDHFNFDIGEMQEEFVCDICVKSFSQLRYLVQHLQSHTGKIICPICKKIFCRKENLSNHGCLKKADYNCKLCDRTFQQKKYLKRHVEAVHYEKFKCDKCQYSYCNKYELSRHNCKAQPNETRRYSCSICPSSFSKPHFLRRHVMRNHSTKDTKTFMCEICVKQYSNKYSYDLHMKNHEEPAFECGVCRKRFCRKDVYQKHLEVHNNKELECNICQKKFKTSKSLFIHQSTHGEPKFKCLNCDKMFKTKSNLRKHSKTHLKSLISTNVSLYSCPYCEKKIKLWSSLIRHINRLHKGNKDTTLGAKLSHKNEQQVPELGFPASDVRNNSFLNSVLDLMTNSEDNIDSINDVEMNDLENNLQIEMIDNIVLDTTNEMGIGLSDDLLYFNNLDVATHITEDESGVRTNRNETTEVSLCMPDLLEHDQVDELGRIALVLDKQTTVDTQENSNNVIFFVMNEQNT